MLSSHGRITQKAMRSLSRVSKLIAVVNVIQIRSDSGWQNRGRERTSSLSKIARAA
jgi:hypothetical protein